VPGLLRSGRLDIDGTTILDARLALVSCWRHFRCLRRLEGGPGAAGRRSGVGRRRANRSEAGGPKRFGRRGPRMQRDCASHTSSGSDSLIRSHRAAQLCQGRANSPCIDLQLRVATLPASTTTRKSSAGMNRARIHTSAVPGVRNHRHAQSRPLRLEAGCWQAGQGGMGRPLYQHPATSQTLRVGAALGRSVAQRVIDLAQSDDLR
jgi:hypothetical protein